MRIAGSVLATVCGIPYLFFVYTVLRSRFGPETSDPHGYGMIFGTLFAVAISIPLVASLPLTFAKDRRPAAVMWGSLAVLVIDIGLIAILMTA